MHPTSIGGVHKMGFRVELKLQCLRRQTTRC